ncbi:MAG: hypothetical protein AMS22_01145 [Thiotrichales bacterium SG8_50]|nr:MAG: hypothetical protein AMS22_01145 [Thiotrichales bacterium SG8_50]
MSVSAVAGVQEFGAPVTQAQWIADGNPLHCTLSHDVPFYGRAVFSKRAGGTLQFTIATHQPPRSEASAMLASIPPQWKHGAVRKDLGEVPVRAAPIPIRLGEAEARRLLAELYAGMFPTLSYTDWADGRDNVNVSLSAVKFRHALGQFVECNEKLLSHDFDAVKHSLVNFEFDQIVLKAEARKRLDQVAAWVVADPSVEIVVVEGHTDSKGTRAYNKDLSRRRAEAVREFFVAQGVAPERLSARHYGESHPVASNRSDSGRAKNRRVTVQLVR